MAQVLSYWFFSLKARSNPWPVQVGFLVDEVALGQMFLQVYRFSPVSIIPPVLHAHSCLCLKH